MKHCPKCKLDKPISEYAKNSRKKDGLQTYCRKCKSGFDYQYYRSDTAGQKGRVKERNTRLRAENRIRIWNYLLEHPCVDCGEEDPIVLDFDHVYNDKAYNISCITTSCWETITNEIEKCEVRCANCHRRKTAKQFGYYSYIVPSSPSGKAEDS